MVIINNQSSNIYIVSVIGILCNKIYVIRWQLALMVEETGVPRDNKWPIISYWYIYIYNFLLYDCKMSVGWLMSNSKYLHICTLKCFINTIFFSWFWERFWRGWVGSNYNEEKDYSLIFNIDLSEFLPVPQYFPVHPLAQLHVKEPGLFRHVPPFKQIIPTSHSFSSAIKIEQKCKY